MEANSSELQIKYQKLATEYSKLRAQVSVLKKGVLDEQSKANELKDVLKERDQSVRRYVQEIDSLTFRNQQLSKRVTVLQDELDSFQSKSKKTKHKGSDANPVANVANNVIGEELQSKIEENARLHKQVFESDQEHRIALMEITEKLDVVQQEASHYKQLLDSIQDQNKIVTDKLQQDKAKLEVRLQTQEKELKEAQLKAAECEAQVKSIQEKLGTELRSTTNILQEKLPFNDSKSKELVLLNIPPYDRKHQARLRDLVAHVALLIKDLVAGLSNFHTYTEQRVKAFPSETGEDRTLHPVNVKFAQYLHENASYLRPLEQSFMAFQSSLEDETFILLEAVVGLKDFAEKFSHYVAYLNKLLPYHLYSIEDECSVSSCTSNLQARNMQFYSALSQLTSVFNKINTYLFNLTAHRNSNYYHPPSSQKRLISLVSTALRELHNIMKDASVQYNAKVTLEHQLPTATQKLKTTDECVLSSMISLVTCTGKLSTIISEKIPQILKTSNHYSQTSWNNTPQNQRITHALSRFRQRASNYLSKLEEVEPDSVPYQEALRNREILVSSTESRESLTRQLVISQEKISKLEQLKEHWMLEFQLLQIKHEKEMKKLHRLEDQIHVGEVIGSVSSGSSSEDMIFPSASKETGAGGSANAHLFGKLEVDNSNLQQVESRENEIKSYFTHRINELVTQMQLADSKAVTYHSELCAQQKRLKLAEQSRTKLQEELTVANKSIDQLKEELNTTTKNYENQLSMMSEHLANMNDKLTVQKDEIDALNYCMNNMGSKKGKR